jgi:hypothetical protein
MRREIISPFTLTARSVISGTRSDATRTHFDSLQLSCSGRVDSGGYSSRVVHCAASIHPRGNLDNRVKLLAKYLDLNDAPRSTRKHVFKRSTELIFSLQIFEQQ